MTDQPQFGIDDCTCIPFTRQTNPPRYLNRPTDTVDMISGWERGRDCPHHVPVVPVSSPPPDQTADRAAVLRELEERYRGHARDSAHPEFSAAYAAVANDLSRLAAEAQQPDTETRAERPRCPHCGLPHDLTPSMELACASIRAAIGDHRVGEAQPQTNTVPPVHKGGNADDCPACIAGGLDTIGPPYECPGTEMAGETDGTHDHATTEEA